MRPHKLQFRFKRGTHHPLYPDNYVGCVGGCDVNFMELLGTRPIRDIVNRNPGIRSVTICLIAEQKVSKTQCLVH